MAISIEAFPREIPSAEEQMTRDETRLLIAFREPQKRLKIASSLQEIGLVLEPDTLGERVNHTDRRFWVRSLRKTPIDQKLISDIESVFQAALEWIAPVYELPAVKGRKGFVCPLPNILLIKPASRAGATFLGRWLHEYRVATRLGQLELKEDKSKSKYLATSRYYTVQDPRRQSAYELKARLEGEPERAWVKEAFFDYMPMIAPIGYYPDDPEYPKQWNMQKIQAGANGPGVRTGWDISQGNGVVVAVLDEGFFFSHRDLTFTPDRIDLSPLSDHGTWCAGVAAAIMQNTTDVAGLAGRSQVMGITTPNWTSAEIATGIKYAVDHYAHVISMSFGFPRVSKDSEAEISEAIDYAYGKDVVLCAATMNDDMKDGVNYPARHPKVIACGASNKKDDRCVSRDWRDKPSGGSNYGPQLSVVAPGVNIPTTDMNAGHKDDFWGTSAATPHVAGLAALLIGNPHSQLRGVQVRAVIERTADKVGMDLLQTPPVPIPYSTVSGKPNGTWNEQMGYGRINALRALEFARALIQNGAILETPESVVRPADDDIFLPDMPSQSSVVTQGLTNYIYIRVTNRGPNDALNVVVNVRVTPDGGQQFVYPADWVTIDPTHLQPTPLTQTGATLGTVPASGTAFAKFTISQADVQQMIGWRAQPCLLVEARADNNYAFAQADGAAGNPLVPLDNVAQRNLSIV